VNLRAQGFIQTGLSSVALAKLWAGTSYVVPPYLATASSDDSGPTGKDFHNAGQ
jgi:hypothetical protein